MSERPLIERLCRSLAFHLVESEITMQHATGETEPWATEIAAANALIVEAGFDLDVLYPPEDRPITSATPPEGFH